MAVKLNHRLVLGVLLVFLLHSATLSKAANQTSDYERLYKKLTTGYNPRVIPASDLPVNVGINVYLFRIVELYESRESLYLDVMINMDWKDDRLAWNATEFSMITQTRIPSSAMWTPDITLYNSAWSQRPLTKGAAVIDNTGSVLTNQNFVLGIHCSVDLRRFPFDTQTCQINLGSWLYSDDFISLSTTIGLALSNYKENAEWELVKYNASVRLKYYLCCPEGYPDYMANITIKRRPGLFTYMFVSPAVLFSLLTPMFFVIPPSSGERTTLGSVLLICLILLLQLLNRHLPPQHIEAPIIGIYYTCTMVFVGLGLALSAFIMNIKTRGGRQSGVPVWLRTVVLPPLKRLVCLDAENSQPYGKLTTGDERTHDVSTEHKMENPSTAVLENDLRYLVKHLKTYNQIRERRQIIEDIVSVWQDVVLVADRVLCVVFLAVNIITTMALLL